MSAEVKPIPDGYRTVTPYLIIDGAADALEFYKQAFGAVERMRMPGPEGKLMHAEMEIDGSAIMLADEFPEMGALSPKTIGGSAVWMHLYVEDADARFAQAIEAGATEVRPLQDQFYGDRSGTVGDPFGYQWTLASHVEDVSPEEMDRRMAEMGKGNGECGGGE